MTEIRLVHISGTKAGERDSFDLTRLPGSRLTLGRDPKCGLAFDPYGDPRVSSHHADIVADAKGLVWLVDQGSTNGTRINGLRIYERTQIRNDDEVELGRKGARFRVEFVSEPAEAASADDSDRGAGDASSAGADEPVDRAEGRGAALGGASPGGTRLPSEGAVQAASEGVRLPDGREFGAQTVEMLLREVGKHEDAGGPTGRPATAVRGRSKDEPDPERGRPVAKTRRYEAGRDAARPATEAVIPRGLRLWLTLVTLVIVLFTAGLIAVGVVLGPRVETWLATTEGAGGSQTATDDSPAPAEPISAAASETSGEALRPLRAELVDLQGRVRAQLRDLDAEIEALRVQQARLATQADHAVEPTDADRLRHALTEARGSVFFLVSEVRLEGDGSVAPYTLRAAGTGFVMTRDGHVVTNKHVIEPWKFDRSAAKMLADDLRPNLETYEIYAWPVGELVLGPNHSEDFLSRTARRHSTGQIQVQARTEDRLVDQTFEGLGRFPVHVPNDNSDLAILQLDGGPFEPLPIWDPTTSAWSPQVFDPVMAVGFPNGSQLFEGRRAEPTPSLGVIRRLGDTLTVSASLIQGNSGGPVFTINRETGAPIVIGVATRVPAGTETLGICLRVEHAWRLLRSAR